MRHAGWHEKRRRKNTNRKIANRKNTRRGIGIACGGFVSGARGSGHTASGSFIQVNEDGGVTVMTGSADIGQGSRTVMAMVVAEELGVDISDVNVISADTETTPIDPGTFSSRVTFYAGNATKIAVRQVKAQLADMAATLMEANAEDLVFRHQKVYVKGNPNVFIPFSELAKKTEALGHGRLIVGHGQWAPDNTQFPDRKTQYGNPSGAYSFAAQIAEVEVDRDTGQVRLINFVVGDDCGQVINALGVEGQAEGSVAMGIGQALMEHVIFGNNGQVMNPSFLDYRIPTTLDCAGTALLDVGSPDPLGPYGAKEIGEGLLISIVPAICNAIYNAVGVRITELPVTPGKILMELEKKQTLSGRKYRLSDNVFGKDRRSPPE
jgi:4-hydroxybenzoyl-CoA reductase subunit alpha